jgi:hypothetical protein
MFTKETKILLTENRIATLSTRQKDNKNIIKALRRELRNLKNA